MAVSYIQAYSRLQSGDISWEGYLDHLLVRFTGNGHPDDDVDGMGNKLRVMDPFGYCLYSWSTKLRQPLDDVTPVKSVLLTTCTGTLGTLLSQLVAPDISHPRATKKAVAFLALQRRRADILQHLLNERGFLIEQYFIDEARKVDPAKDPEIIRILEEAKIEEGYPKMTNRQWSGIFNGVPWYYSNHHDPREGYI